MAWSTNSNSKNDTMHSFHLQWIPKALKTGGSLVRRFFPHLLLIQVSISLWEEYVSLIFCVVCCVIGIMIVQHHDTCVP